MFSELVKKTRSYRNFDIACVYTSDEIKELIDLCRFAPSTANKQPLKFSYTCSKAGCDKVFPLLGWAGYLSEKPPYNGNNPTAYILLCYDTDICRESPEVDIGICAQTIVLGAMEKGIGACMIGNFKRDTMAQVFSLPENIAPRLVIALGKPNEKIVIVDEKDGDIKYYRDKQRTHFVPKRPLDEILLGQLD